MTQRSGIASTRFPESQPASYMCHDGYFSSVSAIQNGHSAWPIRRRFSRPGYLAVPDSASAERPNWKAQSAYRL